MCSRFEFACAVVATILCAHTVSASDVSTLRLVPFPKEIRLQDETFDLGRNLTIEASSGSVEFLAEMIGAELKRAGLPAPKTRRVERDVPYLGLATQEGARPTSVQLRDGATPEDYALEVRPDAVVCTARGEAGLFYGVQTLCQLIRANRRDDGVPCLTVKDWPSLRWRCFQDDMTRGPSSKPETLRFEVATGAHLKMNLFTYYMEYQYAFKKHPLIGPEDGSLTPETLAQLVDYAKRFHVDILGNQQSFGHFAHILKHEEYAHLRETSYLLCPVKEESYQLLDDLYSEVCPILPFPFFNVCCDETYGLGNGPSKELAEEIGTGGVYVQHIRRVHDLLKDKYQKRMMMWGDIILQHPDHLDEVPKDTIMLTWGYGDRPSFEHQIIPFAESGYEFFVCPGVSNWSRILPDFGVATNNIYHFVRDGAKHGALGMLNTAWEDDGEALNAPKWHAYAWGAECAWNASTTTPEQFNRRIGAVLFGEPDDHFGQAIELLAKTHRLPGMQGMNNKRFWQDDFPPRMKTATARDSAASLLEVVRPAIEHLETCKEQATVNKEVLDYFLFGARRMELIGQRMLDGLEAAELYTQAYETSPDKAVGLLAKVEELVQRNRNTYETLGSQFEQLWLKESKPFALDRTLARYQSTLKKYEGLAKRLAEARETAEAGQRPPRPEDLGLTQAEGHSRRTRPHRIESTPLEPDAPWAVPTATHRLGLTVNAGSVERVNLPIELDVELPASTTSRHVRAFCLADEGMANEILGQLDPSDKPSKTRLTLLVAGPLAKGSRTSIHVYLGLDAAPQALAHAVLTADADDGTKWIENDKVRLLLGPEGGHVYRWEVKSLDNRDLTMPGQTGWNGFADAGGVHRSAQNELAYTACGPALVRYRCTDQAGLSKTISVFGGVSWMEVDLNYGLEYYWDFDTPDNFAADGPTPGTYLFSNGATGPVGRMADGVPAQVKAANVHWGIKFNDDRLALGIATPEIAAHHCIGPGSGSGGVGIERSRPASHFVTFAGELDAEPREVMERLRQTLDFRNQPEVIRFAVQPRGGR